MSKLKKTAKIVEEHAYYKEVMDETGRALYRVEYRVVLETGETIGGSGQHKKARRLFLWLTKRLNENSATNLLSKQKSTGNPRG